MYCFLRVPALLVLFLLSSCVLTDTQRSPFGGTASPGDDDNTTDDDATADDDTTPPDDDATADDDTTPPDDDSTPPDDDTTPPDDDSTIADDDTTPAPPDDDSTIADDDTPPAPDDLDEDGYSVAEGDCQDGDPAIHPGTIETWDDQDNDCDGLVDAEGSFGGSIFLTLLLTELGMESTCEGTASVAIDGAGELSGSGVCLSSYLGTDVAFDLTGVVAGDSVAIHGGSEDIELDFEAIFPDLDHLDADGYEGTGSYLGFDLTFELDASLVRI